MRRVCDPANLTGAWATGGGEPRDPQSQPAQRADGSFQTVGPWEEDRRVLAGAKPRAAWG